LYHHSIYERVYCGSISNQEDMQRGTTVSSVRDHQQQQQQQPSQQLPLSTPPAAIEVKVTIVDHPKTHSRSASIDSSNASVCSTSLAVGTFPDSIMTTTTTTNHTNTTNVVDGNDLSRLTIHDDNHDTMTSVSAHGDTTVVEGHEGQHPALSSFCVIDCRTETRIVPNANDVFVLDNDCFTGTVMLLVRTPDVDQPTHHLHLPHIRPLRHDGATQNNNNNNNNSSSSSNSSNVWLGPQQQRVSQYFRGKKRRFEFQFQVRMKKVPTGPLFLGCELERSVKVGGLTKTLVNLLLGMVRRINPGFHYSWGTTPVEANGEYEKTHLSFPVEASMDRIVITRPGDTPPKLGEELEESPESVKRRRKLGAGCVDWNTEDTFTMCLWSAYCDWINWKSINVPGVSPFSLCRVTGKQPIYLCFYEVTSCNNTDYKKKRPPHLQKDLMTYTRLEFSHEEKTMGGIAETKRIVGRRRSHNVLSSDQSVPDTDSVGSDFETMSKISHITN
jgi:Protein of unknown function (DUF1769)